MDRRLSNGSWMMVGQNDEDRFIDQVLERDQWYAPRVGREPMTTRQQVLDVLATGKTLQYDDDWYAHIRLPRVIKNITSDPNLSNEGWVLDCGHTVYHRSHIMMANLGSSCTDCYDRMS